MRYTKKNKPLPFVERLRNTKQQHAAFVKERREVLLSLDLPRIKAFLVKHGEEEATYCDEEPFNAAVRYSIIVDTGIPEADKVEAREWMREHSWFIDEAGRLRKG